MTGGNATHAGITFQDQVAALLAVHVISETPVDFFGLPHGVTSTAIELETSAPIDDILVRNSAGGICFVNVKRSVSLSTKPNSPLGSVVDQIVRLWISCNSSGSARSWQRPLDPAIDRLVLITGGERSIAFSAAASKVLERVADAVSIDKAAVAKTEPEGAAFDALGELIDLAFRRHTGAATPDAALASLLRMTRIVLLDPDGRDKATSLALLKSAVVQEPSEAERAWTELVSICARLAENRTGSDRAGLRGALSARGVRLRDSPGTAVDIQRLRDVTADTLSSLQHLARLDAPTATTRSTIEIHRAVTASLVEHCRQASILIIGEPGSGKSGALYAAAKQISDDGQPVLAIAVDRHPVSTLDELRRELRLERPIIDVLRDWNGDRKGVLFVDALDATRGGPSERVFQDLIRRVLQEAPNWYVIASIRVFDLRFGVVYRDLFEGVPPDSAYRDPEFSHVRHISIPRLTEGELQQVWAASAPMKRAYDDGSPALRELLRSPFNLFLLANVLSSETLDLRGVTTQLQLLQRYWSYRVIGSDRRGMSREGVLRLAVDQMLELGRLQISLADLPGASAEDVDRLLSEGVLAPVDPSRDRLSRISFAHHVLFDYAVARIALEEGRARDFVQRLTDSDQRALLVAPAATIALEALWRDDGSGRPVFWRTALSMAGAAGAGSFCRMLPARVATNLAAEVRDFAPVLDCLRRPDCADRSSAVFLVRHATGALSAGVKHQATPEAPLGPWPAISHALAESAIAEVGWMLKPLVAQWVENPTALSASDAEHIGATARLMLDHGSGAHYDSSMVVVGIQGTTRTFGVAPEQSATALRQLLSREHVAAHGHEELSWVARELPHLYPHGGDTGTVVGDIYRAAYCAALPSADEKTSLGGSRILSLTSNRRQDFEHALWELFEQFPRFFEAAPEDATIALIDVVACSPETQRRFGDEQAVSFDFAGRLARYLPDNSSAWARRHDDHKAPPVRAFETGLVKLADDGRTEELRRVISVVVDRSHAAGVWAALLRAGAAKSREIGLGLQPLLKTVAVLEGRDTRKPAGDLIASVHPLLSEEDRIAVEAAILATDEYTLPILFECLPEAHIASQEARERLKTLREQRPLPANREPFEVTTSWRGGDDDWWLREEGVDLAVAENAALNDAIKAASGLRQAREAGDATVTGRWPAVESLFRVLRTRGD